MNAVEIEETISALAERPSDPQGFLYVFLEAFGNKASPHRRTAGLGRSPLHGCEPEARGCERNSISDGGRADYGNRSRAVFIEWLWRSLKYE